MQVVARYSEVDYEAIDGHRRVLDERGKVLWGWWRKDFEDPQSDLVSRIRQTTESGRPVELGLVNRKTDEYYISRIIGVSNALEVEGSPLVPEGIRTGPVAEVVDVYFLIDTIETTSRGEWVQRFAEPPEIQATLYEVIHENGSKSLIPRRTWNFNPKDVDGDAFLHLTDLHFGTHHAFSIGDRRVGAEVRRVALVQRIVEAVKLSGRNIGAVVCSGDVTSRHESAGFCHAARFFRDLTRELGLRMSDVILVPGNHDFRVLVEGAKPTSDYSHENSYRRFAFGLANDKELCTNEAPCQSECPAYADRDWPRSETYVDDLEALHVLRWFAGSSAAVVTSFLTLNSARLRVGSVKEYGYVGVHRFQRMVQLAAQQRYDSAEHYRIAVMHHHLLPVQHLDVPTEGTPVSLTVDAAEVRQTLGVNGTHLVLHGHKHLPFFDPGSLPAVWDRDSLACWKGQMAICAAGSAGAGPSHMSGIFRHNAVSIIGVSRESLGIEMIGYNEDLGVFQFGEFHVRP